MSTQSGAVIRIVGARQHNLRNLDLDLPLGELIVITGVSGSGKSSLAFDTLYAEGQRRYIETFSPYARQFLDRMDRPQVERIEGIPPAIAIDQTNPVRTSRSTVGTLTELNDHLKLLYARAAQLYCRGCGQPVRRDSPTSIIASLHERASATGDPRILVCFDVARPQNLPEKELRRMLEAQGYVRLLEGEDSREGHLTVIQDRLRVSSADPGRLAEAVDAALRGGRGQIAVRALDDAGATIATWRYSSALHCADCDIAYQDPVPSHFSFNSPLGACETCKGFGRVIGVDYNLVIPDPSKTLKEGAIKPWQTATGKECQDDMQKHAPAAGIPLNVPYSKLTDAQRLWVLQGDGRKGRKHWYGVKGYFDWLESKAYKMHVRVLLSRYRSYNECTACGGARLKPESLLWRLGPYNLHQLTLLPIARAREFFMQLRLPPPLSDADTDLLQEVRTRLGYLGEVGLDYLTLDRQSRTLSGGEVQRINLTTALGTSLVNTLFVLDEPSIGLHPRDMGRVIDVMKRLRDAGNSLVVVEHDPQIMFEADKIIDMGPGPGEHGGQIVFNGTPEDIRSADTLTGAYLGARKHVGMGLKRLVGEGTPRLIVSGARDHNLKNVAVEFPLHHLVCVTGVSGSGKSTLMQDVLFPALQRYFGKATETPGEHDALLGAERLAEAVFVDQSPIGKTARSNPASYVGAFDEIRKLFAVAPMAVQRGYGAGMFSFNAGNGRCPTCGGSGFEHVEMQFLSDVYLRCPDCDGRRFRAEILDVRIDRRMPGDVVRDLSIADVLDLTVAEAVQLFRDDREVVRLLQPIVDVGLEYVKLGQPVPTLSGGEAQRLKLAGFLAESAQSRSASRQGLARKGTLFMFDEPTTGLHFDDIAKLMRSFRRLLEAGHSIVVIEHNLDVIRASDWLIDLGPEGGDAGGEVVATGTPEDVKRHASSHTAKALRDYDRALGFDGAAVEEGAPLQYLLKPVRARLAVDENIRIVNAREHNLKSLDVSIPRGKFSVVTGVSGSGKSTLAFDILFNEGQRRYLESLNAYARSIVQPAGRPEVDAVYGIPPTVAIEQRLSRGGRKSTVATTTEVWHFLRLLY